jgi:hypothetical protein
MVSLDSFGAFLKNHSRPRGVNAGGADQALLWDSHKVERLINWILQDREKKFG